jgi:hypothetical protein
MNDALIVQIVAFFLNIASQNFGRVNETYCKSFNHVESKFNGSAVWRGGSM